MAPSLADGQSLGAASLVLDGQRSDKRSRAWCQNGPSHLRVVTADGLFAPRCKRRDCARCWALRSRELARCLVLDARVDTPTVCITLTTHDPDLAPSVYRVGSAYVFKALRARFGRVEYFGAIEFTTGRARRSGGRRRLHGHYLVKGLDQADVLDAEKIVRRCWAATTGAVVVEVAALVSPGAALGYLGLHHRKASQAPPAEWRGMTERSSRGYWSSPIAGLRERARAELAAEAHSWRTGLPLEVAALEVGLRDPARLIEVRSLGGSDVVEPLGPFNGRLPDETRAAIIAARKVKVRPDHGENPDALFTSPERGSRLGVREAGGSGVALGSPPPPADPSSLSPPLPCV